ncbi:MAG: pullulanase [Saprospiraceae bacterium]|jgi:pullulanase
MRQALPLFLFLIFLISCKNNMKITYGSYEEYPVYEGNLGLIYSPEKSRFRIWAPTADAIKIRLYDQDLGGNPAFEQDLKRDSHGTWQATFNEDIEGKYYTFEATIDGKNLEETPDPYVKAVGTNGKRGQVIDFSKTNPKDWLTHAKPALENLNDIIIYELHVRDLSMSPNSGIQNKGKFLGLTETGTKSPDGLATGLDHIKEMGVTHVHLLPVYDYKSIDESQLTQNKFNWGYDPQNYNVPEGSYSTNPADGAVRIREFKTMVKTLHDNGLRVIMDVVYNHTFDTNTPFEQLVPGYYYRKNEDGSFSNASGCGNETASERLMMRRYIIESVQYWAQEYGIDGFRFDLMGIHDVETMNEVSKTLRAIDPTIVIYGEGWTAGDSPLPDSLRASKNHTLQLNHVAAFSDDIRDAVKGHVFTQDAKAFISGLEGLDESVKFGIVAAGRHPQVDYAKVNYSNAPWARDPHQCINYVSCHDNHTLWDRLTNCCSEFSKADRIEMHKLANTIVLTSQGIPFLHAGVEMVRTKQGEENSYKSPDSINQIDWDWKKENAEVVDYYKTLIQMRKNHPAFRMTTNAQIQQHLQFLNMKENNLVGYQISANANGDEWKDIVVVFNGNTDSKTVDLPKGDWRIVCQNGVIDENGIGEFKGGKIEVAEHSALILKQ